jgi:hypothetical protein
MASRIEVIVRRGARDRFQKLKEKTKELPVAVVWDARKDDRRRGSAHIPDDRRANDRRGRPPFTWDAGDFVVVTKPAKSKKR